MVKREIWVCIIGTLSILSSFASASRHVAYESFASRWMEALPLGNGRLGLMIYGNPVSETYALNEITFWKGSHNHKSNPSSSDAFRMTRKLILDNNFDEAHRVAGAMEGDMSSFGSHLPVGNIKIDFDYKDNKISDYSRSLDIEKAIHTVCFKAGDIVYTHTAFCSNPDQVTVIRYDANKSKSINFNLNLDIPLADTIYFKDNKLIAQGRTDNNGGVNFTLVLGLSITGGEMTYSDSLLTVTCADKVEVYYDLNTDYCNDETYNITVENIDSCIAKDYEQLKNNHITDYSSLYGTVKLNIGEEKDNDITVDKRLSAMKSGEVDNDFYALFFQYSRYLAISSSRENSPLPANLQGLWNDNIACNMPWMCDYHLDINIEQNYWLNNVANLHQCNIPLFNFISRISEWGKKTAKSVYGINRGWVANTMCNVWGYTAPGSIWWGLSPACGIWISLHLWQQYEYTGDIDFLRDIVYPVLKDEAGFYLDYLYLDSVSGYYLSGPSLSPENSYKYNGKAYCLSMMPTFERTLIYELFTRLVECTEILNIDKDFAHELKSVLSLLPPYRVGREGQLQEWLSDYEENHVNHRHTSHLLGLYPYNHITPEQTPELARACEIAISRKLATSDWEDVEFSKANMAMFYARLLKGDESLKCLNSLFDDFMGNNLLTFSPPGIAGAEEEIFIIDGNFASSASIAEMLLQSHKGYIEFIPSIPQCWDSGEFSGLCVCKGGEASAKWRNGKLSLFSITAKVNGNFVLKIPQGKWCVKIGNKSKKIIGNSINNYNLAKGDTIVFSYE
ncbi:MAG: glycoside hydrolase family 95 protein [Muribaculaceae bacterium]|nr:glycoside hydrolase family 95 protein [Muribaculaceae bacterium]